MTRPSDIPKAVYEWSAIFCDANIETPDIDMVARAYLAGQAAAAKPTRFGLTAHQLAALAFLEGQCAGRRGASRPPSLREMARQLDVSLSHVHSLVKALQDRGFVRSLPGRARSITIVNSRDVIAAHTFKNRED